MNIFVYIRINTQKVLMDKQILWHRILAVFCDGGLWKFERTPGGAFKPGDSAMRVALTASIVQPFSHAIVRNA